LAGRLGVEVRTPTDCARQVLGRHGWPGNVRELMNLLERVAICWPERPFDRSVALLALGTGADSGGGGLFFSPSLSSSIRSPLGFSPSPSPLSPSPFSPPLSPSPPTPPLSPSPGWDPGTVSEGLAQYGGNISRLARELGLPRSTLRYRLSRLGAAEGVAGAKGGSPAPVSSRQLLLPLVEPS
jgi:DNA-binding NtrC family response regulator